MFLIGHVCLALHNNSFFFEWIRIIWLSYCLVHLSYIHAFEFVKTSIFIQSICAHLLFLRVMLKKRGFCTKGHAHSGASSQLPDFLPFRRRLHAVSGPQWWVSVPASFHAGLHWVYSPQATYKWSLVLINTILLISKIEHFPFILLYFLSVF